jgi:O-antigen ligase
MSAATGRGPAARRPVALHRHAGAAPAPAARAAIPLFRHAGGATPPAATHATAAADPYALFGVPWWRIGFGMIGIFLYTGARIATSAGEADPELGGFNPINAILQLVILLGSAALVARNWRACLPLLRPAWPFLALLLVFLASATWSQSPQHTVRRCVAILGLMLFVMSTYADLGPRRFLRLVLAAVLGMVALSCAEVVLRPSIGFDVGEYANAIRGVFPQKNAFGMALLAGTLALSFIVLERDFIRPRDVAMLLVLLVMLKLSRSTTSLLLTLFTTGGTLAILAIRRGGLPRALALLGMASGLAAGLLFFAAVGTEGMFDAIGKDSTLTGRTQIWAAVADLIRQRPLTGYGYAAFWIVDTPGVRYIWDVTEWEVPTAHSGYREVLLQLGAVGAAAGFCILGVALWRIARAIGRGQARRAVWMMMFLVILSVLSFSESALFNPDMQLVLWMLGTMALLDDTLHRAPLAPPPPPGPLFRSAARPWGVFRREG